MSKSVASESKDGYEAPKTSMKRGGEDEEKEDGEGINEGRAAENSTTLTAVVAAPAATDQFMHTPEFGRHFVELVPGDTLMRLRLATNGWKAAVDAFIDEGVESGEIMVHSGNDIVSWSVAYARKERRKLVTRVIFLLNITKVGDYACTLAVNLVIVDIPEGIESIGRSAFHYCRSLPTVSFPTTLTSIGDNTFFQCSSLDNVDLLHTNLHKLGDCAFCGCSELKSMTIPDSLQTIGRSVFCMCDKLVPSNIDVEDRNVVVAYSPLPIKPKPKPKLTPPNLRFSLQILFCPLITYCFTFQKVLNTDVNAPESVMLKASLLVVNSWSSFSTPSSNVLFEWNTNGSST